MCCLKASCDRWRDSTATATRTAITATCPFIALHFEQQQQQQQQKQDGGEGEQQTLGKHLPRQWHASLGLIFNCAAVHFNWNMEKGKRRPGGTTVERRRARQHENRQLAAASPSHSLSRSRSIYSLPDLSSSLARPLFNSLSDCLPARQSSSSGEAPLSVGLLKHKDNLSCPHWSRSRSWRLALQLGLWRTQSKVQLRKPTAAAANKWHWSSPFYAKRVALEAECEMGEWEWDFPVRGFLMLT